MSALGYCYPLTNSATPLSDPAHHSGTEAAASTSVMGHNSIRWPRMNAVDWSRNTDTSVITTMGQEINVDKLTNSFCMDYRGSLLYGMHNKLRPSS